MSLAPGRYPGLLESINRNNAISFPLPLRQQKLGILLRIASPLHCIVAEDEAMLLLGEEAR